MVADFETILKNLETESGELFRQNTLAWYLAQIRVLVGKASPDSAKRDTNLAVAVGRPRGLTPVTFPQDTVNSVSSGSFQGFSSLLIGQMVMYIYDAKHKETLPYWDRFPLVFPINLKDDGFLGINLHYLPPYERARLMTALYGLINNRKIDEKTKLNISYRILANSSRYRYFKPCVKRYLSGHLRSRLYIINPLEWDRVLLLPLANFQKAEDYKVWQDSINSIRKKK